MQNALNNHLSSCLEGTKKKKEAVNKNCISFSAESKDCMKQETFPKTKLDVLPPNRFLSYSHLNVIIFIKFVSYYLKFIYLFLRRKWKGLNRRSQHWTTVWLRSFLSISQILVSFFLCITRKQLIWLEPINEAGENSKETKPYVWQSAKYTHTHTGPLISPGTACIYHVHVHSSMWKWVFIYVNMHL